MTWLWLAPALAASWTTEELRPLSLPFPAEEVVVGTWQGSPTVIARGAQGLAAVIDGAPATTAPLLGADLLLEDLDGDGNGELLLCGADGVQLIRGAEGGFGSALRLVSEPCTALATRPEGDTLALLVLGPKGLASYAPGEGGLQKTPLESPPGADRLTVDVQQLAFAQQGVDGIWFTTPWGRSSAGTGGPVDRLTVGPRGWTWSVPGVSGLRDVSHKEISLAGEPTALASADLDGDGVIEVLAAWAGGAELAVIGLEERRFSTIFTPRAIGVGDLTGDGCPDVVVAAEGGQGSVLVGRCSEESPTGGEVSDTGPLAVPIDGTPSVAADGVTHTLQLGAWTELELPPYEPVKVKLLAAGSPTSFSALGLPPGLEVQGGFLVGSIQRQAEYRVTVTLYDGRIPRVPATGFTLRTEGLGRLVGGTTVQLGLPTEAERGTWSIQSCQLGVGAAIGVRGNGNNWQNLDGGRWRGLGSPAASFVCAGGTQRVQWFGGVDTAIAMNINQPDGFAHILGLSAGVQYGQDDWRVGPFGSVGLLLYGLGVRGEYMPFRTRTGGRHGFEGRLFWTPAGGEPTFQVMALYAFTIGG